MQKIFVLVLVVLALFTAHYRDVKLEQIPDQAVLVKSFEFSGANIFQSRLQCQAKFAHEVLCIDELEALVKQTIRVVVPEGKVEPIKTNSSDLIKNAVVWATNQSNEIVQIEAYTNSVDDERGTFVTMDIVKEREFRDVGALIRRVEQAFKDIGLTPQIELRITGTYDGRLTQSNFEHLRQNILGGIKAKVVENVVVGDVHGVTAYSPMIKGTINSGSKYDNASNLNITTRYNALEDKTYIELAIGDITVKG